MLTTDQARLLLESLDASTLVGLRDRALIGVMTCAFARVSANYTADLKTRVAPCVFGAWTSSARDMPWAGGGVVTYTYCTGGAGASPGAGPGEGEPGAGDGGGGGSPEGGGRGGSGGGSP